LLDAGAPLAAGLSPDVDGLEAVASVGERQCRRRLGQVDVEMKDPSCNCKQTLHERTGRGVRGAGAGGGGLTFCKFLLSIHGGMSVLICYAARLV